MTDGGHKLDLELMKGTSYLTLIGELWGAYCEDLGDNWPCYNSTTQYVIC